MVLWAIWNELRHLVVKDDLLAGVTLRRAACHVGCHSKPKIPGTYVGNCSIPLNAAICIATDNSTLGSVHRKMLRPR